MDDLASASARDALVEELSVHVVALVLDLDTQQLELAGPQFSKSIRNIMSKELDDVILFKVHKKLKFRHGQFFSPGFLLTFWLMQNAQAICPKSFGTSLFILYLFLSP